jgi:hypothetical protein
MTDVLATGQQIVIGPSRVVSDVRQPGNQTGTLLPEKNE